MISISEIKFKFEQYCAHKFKKYGYSIKYYDVYLSENSYEIKLIIQLKEDNNIFMHSINGNIFVITNKDVRTILLKEFEYFTDECLCSINEDYALIKAIEKVLS